MSVARYALGWLWLVVLALALVAPAVRWRRRLCHGWGWVPSRLAEAVLAWSAAIVLCEVLGAVGLFTPGPVIVAAVGVGVAAWFLAPAERPRRMIGYEPMARWEPVAAIGFGAFVLAEWGARTISALGQGMTDVDTLSYHLPHAARFVQDGWLTRLHFIAPDEATAYHPSNGEVAHSLGMMAWHRDPLSLVLNLGWLVLLLGAAWCVGRRLGSGALAVGAVSVVLVTPLIASTQAASGMTDTVSVAFLLIAAYLLLAGADSRAALPLAGLAGGLALGSKLTLVVPFVALSVVVLVLAPRLGWPRRSLACAAWFAPAFMTGSFWYLRNIARVGTPIPTLHIGVGSVALPKPPIALERYAYTVAHYLFDGAVWAHWFVPGLHHAFGVLWPVLVVGAVLVGAVVVWRGPVVARGLGAVALATVIAYLFTQTTAFGPQGQPVLFTANLRYVLPGLALALALLPAAVVRRTWLPVAAGLVGVLVVITGVAPNAWPSDGRAGGVALGLVGGILALVLLWVLDGIGARFAIVGAVIVGLVAVVAGLPVTRRYLDRRYTVAASSQVALGAWANGLHHANIGIAGFFMQYPLYGQDLSNRVQYIGDFTDEHAFTDFRTCTSWRRAVNHGGYRFVVIAPSFPSEPDPPALGWTRGARGVSEVLVNDRVHVFRVDSPLEPTTCPQ